MPPGGVGTGPPQVGGTGTGQSEQLGGLREQLPLRDDPGVWEKKGENMAWHIEGTYFENCSCDVSCPCTTTDFALPADYEQCQFLMAFHVASGEVD
ncbi:MAG: DUF1326 domain-containing protein, partial [Actinobacteria bacterium]|nr:DUF1326 domain-containing protein [Actinomycetota bacterium]